MNFVFWPNAFESSASDNRCVNMKESIINAIWIARKLLFYLLAELSNLKESFMQIKSWHTSKFSSSFDKRRFAAASRQLWN